MSRIARVLSAAEAADNFCDVAECGNDPTFAVVLPAGERVACEEHLDHFLALVPPGFAEVRERAAERASCAEALAASRFTADVRALFSVEDALGLAQAEVQRRARGLAPDPRFDPLFDALLDLADPRAAV